MKFAFERAGNWLKWDAKGTKIQAEYPQYDHRFTLGTDLS